MEYLRVAVSLCERVLESARRRGPLPAVVVAPGCASSAEPHYRRVVKRSSSRASSDAVSGTFPLGATMSRRSPKGDDEGRSSHQWPMRHWDAPSTVERC